MEEQIHIKIVSPGRSPILKTADNVSIYASDGSLEVYPNHAPLVFMLGTGICDFYFENQTESIGMFEGIGHLVDNELTLCPDYLELPDEIDVERAQQSLNRANKRLLGKDPEVPRRNLQQTRANKSRHRSIVRLRLKGIAIDE